MMKPRILISGVNSSRERYEKAILYAGGEPVFAYLPEVGDSYDGLLLSGGAQSFSPERDVEYRQYKQMGEELKRCLMQVRKAQREEAAAAAAPKAAVTCPWCGATSIPDQNGCCEYCGGSVNG